MDQNIVSIVVQNSGCDDPLLKKIQQNLNMDQRDIFIKSFYCYMNYHSTNDYPINLEDVFKMIGFANKENAKRTLRNNFTMDEDYKKLLVRTDEEVPNIKDGKNIGGGGLNKEDIMLNIDTFKNLCMLAKTENGKQIRKYYIKMEEIMMEYTKEQFVLQLKEKEQREIQYKNQLELKELELQHYKQKIYEEIDKHQHVYVIKTDGGGYKVGKTKDDITKRIKGLQTGNVNNIEIIFDFHTSNADLLEKMAHYVLDRYRCNSNREFFDCDIGYIKNTISILGKTLDTLRSSFQHITIDDLLNRLNYKMNVQPLTFSTRGEVMIQPPDYNDDFYKFLEKHIVYKKDSMLSLKHVCESFLNVTNPHSRISALYKIQIENYIKLKYNSIVDSYYKDSTLHGERYKGWLHLKFEEII
jgi:phage anti-repressor protein